MPKTLYLRNVPDDVAERLERLAQQAGMSTSAFAVRELGRLSRRADNAALLDDLPDLGLGIDSIVDDIRAAREERVDHLAELGGADAPGAGGAGVRSDGRDAA